MNSSIFAVFVSLNSTFMHRSHSLLGDAPTLPWCDSIAYESKAKGADFS